jgi:anti-sigma regulatory factor (Ser/Thr protein kinase)
VISFPVRDTSHVAETRREIVSIAASLGFDEGDRGRVALIVTELATNLLKHAREGVILAGADRYTRGPAIELLSLDRGAGMQNVHRALEDGVSTSGTSGTGMGAIIRQAHEFDILSLPDLGTAIYVRSQAGKIPERNAAPSAPYGAVSVPTPTETANGDAWAAAGDVGRRTFLVVDGLGHGVHAAEASQAALVEFQRCSDAPLAEILANIHRALRPTRGAAVSVARTDEERDVLVFAGIGNVSGAIVNGAELRKTVSRNGTAGHQVARIQEYEYPFNPGSHFFMYSDGLLSSWSIKPYPGLLSRHPTLIAGVLSRDFWRERDDVTVLVAERERT